jgi:hypothetical protein
MFSPIIQIISVLEEPAHQTTVELLAALARRIRNRWPTPHRSVAPAKDRDKIDNQSDENPLSKFKLSPGG